MSPSDTAHANRASHIEYLQSILDTVRDPMLVLDSSLRVVTASRAFCHVFEVSPAETEGQLIYRLGNGQWNIPRLRELLEVILPEHTVFNEFEVRHAFPQIGERVMLLNARKLWRPGNETEHILLFIEDVTARRREEQDSRRVAQLYERLLASSSDCIKLLDLDGNLLSMNENGQRGLGITDVQSVLGSCWMDFWGGEDNQAAQQAVQEARAGRGSEFEGYFATMQGEPHWWHVAVSPVMQEGKPEFILAVSRDITPRKLHEEAILQAQLELRRSNEDLEQFARIAGHDLRAPLASMVQSSQVLLRRCAALSVDAESRKMLDYVVTAGKRMARMLDDMLHYARISQQSLRVSTPVSVGEACSLATENLKSAIAEANASIDCEIGDDMQVNLDLGLLVQVIQNLMSNAINYRQEGVPPVIRLKGSAQGNNWQLAVADNGVGIANEHQERIFSPFVRLHGQERPGSGIGLASCKRMVERAGGRIRVESEPGRGSTFYVELPKAIVESPGGRR